MLGRFDVPIVRRILRFLYLLCSDTLLSVASFRGSARLPAAQRVWGSTAASPRQRLFNYFAVELHSRNVIP